MRNDALPRVFRHVGLILQGLPSPRRALPHTQATVTAFLESSCSCVCPATTGSGAHWPQFFSSCLYAFARAVPPSWAATFPPFCLENSCAPSRAALPARPPPPHHLLLLPSLTERGLSSPAATLILSSGSGPGQTVNAVGTGGLAAGSGPAHVWKRLGHSSIFQDQQKAGTIQVSVERQHTPISTPRNTIWPQKGQLTPATPPTNFHSIKLSELVTEDHVL